MSYLYSELKKLNERNVAPFHMPGHKRSMDCGAMSDYYQIDITEIDDYDNLHDAEGIILEAEQRANRLYGADETHFLVNGSTGGVLSAVCASVKKRGKIIVSRNCHKSFYHAAYLNELDMKFIYPDEKVIERAGSRTPVKLMGEVSPETIRKAVDENPDAEAVFITSPTYEGIPSDIKAISEIVHERNMILIVDEAHGAHFGIAENRTVPAGAVMQGADIVIHSLHKTLASMTQTALIHVQGNRVNRERLRRYLRIFQSSSPSYVLMSSMDSCIKDITERGHEIFSKLISYRRQIEEETKGCRRLFIPDMDQIEDPCKVLICSGDPSVSGQQIYDILRIEYNIQLEMAGDTYGLAIITGYDSEQNIRRLIAAINEIDSMNIQDLCAKKDEAFTHDQRSFDNKSVSIEYLENESVIPFSGAWDAETEEVDITEVTGRVSAEFINLYPPGIPLIIPGEKFSRELVVQIQNAINAGMNVQGVRITDNSERKIKVIDFSANN